MTPSEQFASVAPDLRQITDSLPILFPGQGRTAMRKEFFISAAIEVFRKYKYEADPLLPFAQHFINTHEGQE